MSIGLFQKAVFCVAGGSLIDLVDRRVPTYADFSARTNLEREVGGGIQLQSIPAFLVPFSIDDSSVLMEPGRKNLITFNNNLGHSLYQKGSSVVVFSDRITSPLGSLTGDVATWFGGVGEGQKIIRPITLEPQSTYVFWGYFQSLGNSRFGGEDKITIESQGDVSATPIRLSDLNDVPERYTVLQTTIEVGGTIPQLPEESPEEPPIIVSMTANTLSLQGLSGILEGQLVGGRISSNAGQEESGDNEEVQITYYDIVGNTASIGEDIVISVLQDTLLSDEIAVEDPVSIVGAADIPAQIEFNVENTASLGFGGIFLEKSSFRSSPIYQNSEIIGRAETACYYKAQDNPISDRFSFTIFVDLPLWRGDGNIADFGNLRIYIEDSTVKASAGSVVISDTAPLESESVSIAVVVSSEAANLSLYVNRYFKASASLSGFQGNNNQPFILTSLGVRKIRNLTVFNEALLHGGVEVGQPAGGEISDVFRNEFIPIDAITSSGTQVILNTVRIPGITTGGSDNRITNVTSTAITIGNTTEFSVGDSVVIIRGATTISYAVVQSKTATNLTLDSTAGIIVGDIAARTVDRGESRVFIRFPWVPLESQVIQSVDTGEKSIIVPTTLSFEVGKAFISNSSYQEIKEILIFGKDNASSTLMLSDVEGIEPGQFIGQPRAFSETLIHPNNYMADFLVPLRGVEIEYKAQNGVVVVNREIPSDIEMTPYIVPVL